MSAIIKPTLAEAIETLRAETDPSTPIGRSLFDAPTYSHAEKLADIIARETHGNNPRLAVPATPVEVKYDQTTRASAA